MNEKFEVLGPLDLTRHINEEAARLDVFADNLMSNKNATEGFLKEIETLDETHPLLGQDVIAYGNSLTMSVVSEDSGLYISPLALPPENRGIDRVRGTYNGLYVKLVDTNAEMDDEDKYSYRVVHGIRGETTGYTDILGHNHVQIENVFICANGAEITPTEPINAHSLIDLKNDKIIEHVIEKFAFKERMPKKERIRKIGKIATEAFTNLRFEEAKNHQRVSYLNSLGLLDGFDVLVRDCRMVKDDNYDIVDTVAFSNMDSMYNVEAGHFVLSPSYVRVGAYRFKVQEEKLDLCIRTDTTEYTFLVPVKNVLEYIPK